MGLTPEQRTIWERFTPSERAAFVQLARSTVTEHQDPKTHLALLKNLDAAVFSPGKNRKRFMRLIQEQSREFWRAMASRNEDGKEPAT